MYVFFAYLGGSWGLAGADPHEECAVRFIDFIDGEFGEGTAFVVKLPDRDDYTPTGDEAEHFAAMTSMQDLLQRLETNELDLDDALKKFNN